MTAKRLLSGLLSLGFVSGCAPSFQQLMREKADGTRSPMPLPKRCVPVADLHLRNRELRLLSDFITRQNQMHERVDIRRHGVCLTAVATQQHLGLFKIESVVASHWTAQYFINGSRGISVIRITGDSAKTTANIRVALQNQEAALPPELIKRIAGFHIP